MAQEGLGGAGKPTVCFELVTLLQNFTFVMGIPQINNLSFEFIVIKPE